MSDPIPYPASVEWSRSDVSSAMVGRPSFDHDAFEQEILIAREHSFEVSLGSFILTGDARGYDESMRYAEEAFKALVDLNNKLSSEKP